MPPGDLASTGNGDVDELLLGGLRRGTNALVTGEPFTPKDLLCYAFVNASVERGESVIVVLVDRGIPEVAENLRLLGLDPERAEESASIVYIDAYSRSIQVEPASKLAIQIDSPANVSMTIKAIDSVAQRLRLSGRRYNMVLWSLTSYPYMLEQHVLLRLLQQVAQKRKNEGCVSLYVLDEGIFEERFYEAINYVVDGKIRFRREGSRDYLRAEGFDGAATREWVEVVRSGATFHLGSFNVERIR
ncbi:hypothetical protein GCM10007108_04240 [Thermogymnomonas acidicola]|uniref:KaiC-like domain-containing protein n=1 Tax=Thermogymnomonas acidicola TaxID=399579 RepID=A0AA37BQ80_9ARCH|nr:RAD55 family ATPase [Thermogymnomonas acidicola]GGM69309.1 hypothetical protein GCM10007108_04240 [Thermogymnomonas acidicola]